MRAVALLLALLLLAGCVPLKEAGVPGMAVHPPVSGSAKEPKQAAEPAQMEREPELERSQPPEEKTDTKQEWEDVEYFCGAEDCPGHRVNLFETKLPPVCTRAFSIDLTLVGDCLISTYMGGDYQGSLNWYAKNREATYFFEKVSDIFAEDDFTIANLETVLTDQPLAEVEKDHDPAFWFKGPTKNIEIMASSSVEVVSMSNNHTGDYGEKGFQDTVAAVEEAGLLYGSGSETVYLEKQGFVIALICSGLWTQWHAGAIVERIREAEEQSDYQVVFFHGGTEGAHAPEDWMVQSCHELVDAGADLVVGCHPHVLQPVEEYKGVKIAYSLGNFCFGGNSYPENRTAIYRVRLTVDRGEVMSEEHKIIPCYVYTGKSNNWQPAPIEDEVMRQHVLDFMEGKRWSPF